MGGKMVRNTCMSALLVVSLQAPNTVTAGAAIGATEPTQWLNNIQLVISYAEHAANTIENIENNILKAENMARDFLSPIYDVKTTLDNVRDTVRDGLGIAYSLQNIDQVFRDRYKSFDDFMAADYDRIKWSQDIRAWTSTTEDSIKNALEAAGIQMESLDDEDQIMQQLYDKAQSGGKGHQKALDVANEINMMTAKQLQSLRQLVATDMQIKGAFFQQENAIRKATEAAASEYFEPTLTTPEPEPALGNGETFGARSAGVTHGQEW